MKIKEGFILRKVSDAYVVVATGEAAKSFNGMITLNSSGAYLWEKLASNCDTKEKLVSALLDEYEVTEEQASKDVDIFVGKMSEAGIFAD